MSKVCEDPLDAYIETMDVLELMNTSGSTQEAAIGLLDQSPRVAATAAEIGEGKKYASALLEDYGRGFTQTLSDNIIEIYTERFIHKALRKMLNACCDKYIVIPDYAPRDGRLHFHGIVTFKHLKDTAKLRRLSKSFGWSKIDQEPTAGLPEYIFKIYEKNKYTPKNTRLEELPLKYIMKK